MRMLVLVGVVALTACNVAPREVETVITLKAERVDIDVQLRDIRTGGRDDLYQFQVFEALSQWHTRWTEDWAWAPAPDVYRYTSDAGVLWLSMHATMTRSAFDACARDGGACEKFPLQLDAKGYSVLGGLIEGNNLVLARGAPTAWPADAGVIAISLGLTTRTEEVIAGPSLIRGFEIFSLAPEKASATAALINETEKRLYTGTADEWQKTLAELTSCLDRPWCELRKEAMRRSQAQLLHRYLWQQREAMVALRSPPEDPRMVLPESIRGLVPADKVSLVDALRLRIRYDAGLAAYDKHGSLAWSGETWAAVCRPDVVKRRSLKELCIRLGAL